MKRQGRKPLVGIIMGSDSDLPIMQEAAKALEELAVPFELGVVSAHRTPDLLVGYAKRAASRGLKVLIAGAGGAAHLPGMTAAFTPLPVIGVPIKTRTAAGIDSLFSIVQMPPGIPVATVAINGARNAGILAASIVAAGDASVLARVARLKEGLKKTVLKKAKTLHAKGFSRYLREHL